MPRNLSEILPRSYLLYNEFNISQNIDSHVLVYANTNSLNKGTIAICFDDLSVRFLTKDEFDAMHLHCERDNP